MELEETDLLKICLLFGGIFGILISTMLFVSWNAKYQCLDENCNQKEENMPIFPHIF